MSNATDFRHRPHIAVLPSAGMGHVSPLLRIAAMLASRSCHVTLITAQPTISATESTHITAFLAAYPTINPLAFQIAPYTPPTPTDPFNAQFEAIVRSAHLLSPLLASISSPPLTAIFSDITVAAGVCQVAHDLGIPSYIVSTTCARFTSLAAYMPYLTAASGCLTRAETSVVVPGLAPFDISRLPQPFFNANHVFTQTFIANGKAMSKANGILTNTFHAFEPETIAAVNGGKAIPNFPPLLPIGPLEPHKLEVGDRQPLPWLDQQPPESVVYVCFGSRTAMSSDQIRELGKGLEGSGHKFLWVLKSRVVDREDSKGVEELVGDSFLESTREKGLVVKGWVNQEEILSHPSIRCFFSHGGWNSMMEAAARGMPVLAWPLGGDQMVNAEVVEKAGLAVWERGWNWLGERLVKGEEIAEKVKMAMSNETLREKARKVGEEAKKAMGAGGSSDMELMDMIHKLQTKE